MTSRAEQRRTERALGYRRSSDKKGRRRNIRMTERMAGVNPELDRVRDRLAAAGVVTPMGEIEAMKQMPSESLIRLMAPELIPKAPEPREIVKHRREGSSIDR